MFEVQNPSCEGQNPGELRVLSEPLGAIHLWGVESTTSYSHLQMNIGIWISTHVPKTNPVICRGSTKTAMIRDNLADDDLSGNTRCWN